MTILYFVIGIYPILDILLNFYKLGAFILSGHPADGHEFYFF